MSSKLLDIEISAALSDSFSVVGAAVDELLPCEQAVTAPQSIAAAHKIAIVFFIISVLLLSYLDNAHYIVIFRGKKDETSQKVHILSLFLLNGTCRICAD